MATILQKIILQQNSKSQISQSLALHFSKYQWKQNIGVIHYEKMSAISRKIIAQQNPQLLTPQKIWVSIFLSVDRNGILVSAIMKKWKNGCHFTEKRQTAKFPITDPPRFWVSTFSVSTEMEF